MFPNYYQRFQVANDVSKFIHVSKLPTDIISNLDPRLKPLTESVTDKLSASADFIMRRTPTPFAFPIRYELFFCIGRISYFEFCSTLISIFLYIVNEFLIFTAFKCNFEEFIGKIPFLRFSQ